MLNKHEEEIDDILEKDAESEYSKAGMAIFEKLLPYFIARENTSLSEMMYLALLLKHLSSYMSKFVAKTMGLPWHLALADTDDFNRITDLDSLAEKETHRLVIKYFDEQKGT